ncbi:hypothetical protein ACW95P_04280 [Candidatus Mycoplasma pogonae]
MKKISNKNKKFSQFTKSTLLVLSMTPLLGAIGAIVSADKHYTWLKKIDGESIRDWIKKNRLVNFTSRQIDELNKLNYNFNQAQWIHVMNDKMGLMRMMHKLIDSAVNGKTDFSPHFLKNTNYSVNSPFAVDLSRVSNILLEDDFGTDVSPIDENNITQAIIKLSGSWGGLNGFAEELNEIFRKTKKETNNLNPQQKAAYFNNIQLFKQFIIDKKIQPFNNEGHVNENYVNQWKEVLQEFKKTKDNFKKMYQLDEKMASLKDVIKIYEANKVLFKYTNATPETRRAFDNAIAEAKKDFVYTQDSFINNFKQDIKNKWNALAGIDNREWKYKILEEAKTRVISGYDKLSKQVKDNVLTLLEGRATIGQARNEEQFREFLKARTDALEKLNNTFPQLEEAFNKYTAVIGTPKHDQASNKLNEDDKVLKLIEEILSDPGRGDGATSDTLWKPVDSKGRPYLTKKYHITYLKIKERINERKIQETINGIDSAIKALNGEVVSALNDYLSAIGTGKYDTATNQAEQNKIVFDTLNEILQNSVTQPSPLEKNFSIGNNLIKTGKTEAEISAAASKIRQAKSDLNGSELGAQKTELKNKLNIAPLIHLNTTTKNAIIKAIDEAITKNKLDEISIKLDKLATNFNAANSELSDLKNYKTTLASKLNYRLADDSLKIAFNQKFDALKNKLDNAKNASGINIWENDGFANAFSELETAKNNLNGTINKNQAFTNIDNLINIADSVKQAIKDQIEKNDKAEKIESKTAMQALVNNLKATNNKFTDLKIELKKYTDLIGNQKHNLSTNKDSMDINVKNALKSVINGDEFTTISNTTNLDSKKLKATNVGSIEAAISIIRNSIAELNGDKVAKVNAAKANINSLNKLSPALKSDFTNKLLALNVDNKTETLADFEKNQIKPITDKAVELQNEFSNVNAALISFRDKYYKAPEGTEATNRESEWNKVIDELNTVISISLSKTISPAYELQTNNSVMFKNGITIDDVKAVIKKINESKKSLKGLEELNTKKESLKNELNAVPFNKLNSATIAAFKNKINNSNSSSELEAIKNKATKLANEMDRLKAKITVGDAAKTNENYNLASTVKKANFDAALNALKVKVNNEDISEKSVSDLNSLDSNLDVAFGNLDGLLNKAKNDLRSKLMTEPINKLNAQTITAINSAINSAADVDSVKALNTKILSLATAFNNAKNAAETLKSYQSNANYKLADNDKKATFDQKLKALEDLVNSPTNILDTASSVFDSAKTAVEIAKAQLNGNTNLSNAVSKIKNDLNHLSITQKTESETKIKDLTKVNSKSALDSVMATFTNINTELGTTKSAINAIANLTENEKKTFIEKLDQINITNLTDAEAKTIIENIKLEAKKIAWVNKAAQEIEALLHLSGDLIDKIKNQLNSFSKTDSSEFENVFKDKIDEIKSKAKTLNNKYTNEIEVKFNDYLSTIGTVKYDEATNQTEQNDIVYAALNEIAKPVLTKPTTLTKTTSISGLKIDAGSDITAIPALLDNLITKVTKIAEKIEEAKNNLNGENVLVAKIAEKQKTLNDLLNDETKFGSLSNEVKNAIKTKIDSVGNSKAGLEKLTNEIEPKIYAANEIIKKLNNKITALEKAKTDHPLNYNLADDDKKVQYDKAINDLKNQLKENLFDSAKVSTAEAVLKTADGLALNGHDNLDVARKVIDGLDNLGSDQKIQAKNKLEAVSSKEDLNNKEKLFTSIDTKFGLAKTVISTNDKLISTEQSALNDKLEAINISDLTAETTQNKINEVTLEADKTALLNEAIKEVNNLTNLSPSLIQKIKDKLNNFNKVDATQTKDDFKTLLDNIKNKATTLNDKFKNTTNGVVKAFSDYVATVGTDKYDESTNKNQQNNVVYTALSEIVKPEVSAPTTLTNAENINTLKVGFKTTDASKEVENLLDELIAKTSDVINEINKAKADLNGETIISSKISEKKKELQDFLNDNTEFNSLPDSVKNKIKNEISGVSDTKIDLNKLNELETKIVDAKNTIKTINDKIAELETKQNDKNYKLANESNKKDFDQLIQNLKDQLKKDLFDKAKKDAALVVVNDITDTTANAKLNGNDNLDKALNNAKTLSNLSDEQKTQAENKLKDFNKIDSKEKLEAAENLLSEINDKLKKANDDIKDLPHLTKTTQDKAIEDLGKINITDLTTDQAHTAIDTIVNQARELNTSLEEKLTKLKEELAKYTSEIGKTKHDVTENVVAIDSKVVSALKTVIDKITDDTKLINAFAIDDNKLTTNDPDAIQVAINQITTALNELNGDDKIKELTNKLNSDAELNLLNSTTKAKITEEANKVTSFRELEAVKAKAEQAAKDYKAISDKIAELEAIKNDANNKYYLLASPAKQAAINSAIFDLENKLTNDDLYGKTSSDIEAILKPANDAVAALNGNENLTTAETKIKALSNINKVEQNTILTELGDLAKINSELKLNEVVDKFTNVNNFIGEKISEINNLTHFSKELQDEVKANIKKLEGLLTKDEATLKSEIETVVNNAKTTNDKFVELKTKVAAYKNAMTTPDYTEDTSENQTLQNNKVKDALESVLKDKTYANIETDLQELNIEKFKSRTTLAKVEAAITKIETARSSLNGSSHVDEDKEKLKQKVENTTTGDYKDLNDATKKAILNDLNNVDTDTKVEVVVIDEKATKALDLQTKLQDKINVLKEYQKDKDYKLASLEQKTAFDTALTKLEQQVKSNLYDNQTEVEKTTNDLITVAETTKTALKGNENLQKAKDDIQALSNLNKTTTRDIIEASLDNIDKFSDQTLLNNEVLKWTSINTKLEDLKNALKTYTTSPLEHLSQVAKEAFIAKAQKIENLNADQAAIEAKIAEVKTTAKETNAAYNDLKTAYDAYKAKMATADYVDATESTKTTADQTVKNALDSILDATTIPSANNNLEGKIKANIDAAKIQEAKTAIEKALDSLNGNENLAKLKEEVLTKLEPGNEFNSLSDATKETIRKNVNDAKFASNVNDTNQRAKDALNISKGIEDTIKKLENAKSTVDYKLASDDKQTKVNDVLQDLKDLKNSDLLDASAKHNLNTTMPKAAEAIDNLDGNENLDKAKAKVDSFNDIPEAARNSARDNLPTTSLTDLDQKVDDLKKINGNIAANKDIISKLPNLDQATKDKLNEDASHVDLSKSKDKNIENSNNVKDNAVDLNNKFIDFKLDLDNYLSVQQTPAYTAATNNAIVNQKVVATINSILSNHVQSAGEVTQTSTFKHGVSVVDINIALKAIENAIAQLDGNQEVIRAKQNVLDTIATAGEYKTLSYATKQTLKEMVNEIGANETDWENKLSNVLLEANNALNLYLKIDLAIAKAKIAGLTNEVVKLQEAKETSLVTLPSEKYKDGDETSGNSPNKLWWLLSSLLALIPLAIWFLIFFKFKKKK